MDQPIECAEAVGPMALPLRSRTLLHEYEMFHMAGTAMRDLHRPWLDQCRVGETGVHPAIERGKWSYHSVTELGVLPCSRMRLVWVRSGYYSSSRAWLFMVSEHLHSSR